MKVIYDPETDALTVIFKEAPVAESAEDKQGIILDYRKFCGKSLLWMVASNFLSKMTVCRRCLSTRVYGVWRKRITD